MCCQVCSCESTSPWQILPIEIGQILVGNMRKHVDIRTMCVLTSFDVICVASVHRFNLRRQVNAERAALPGFAGEVNVAAVGFREHAHDVEAETAPGGVVVVGVFGAVVEVEGGGLLLFVHALAAVCHLDNGRFPFHPRRDHNLAFMGRVFDGIVDEIVEDLLQPVLVKREDERIRPEMQRNFLLASLSHISEHVDSLRNDIIQIFFFGAKRKLPLF